MGRESVGKGEGGLLCDMKSDEQQYLCRSSNVHH